MRILVTGGAGFVGSNFIRFWIKKYPQDEIINLDKLTYAGNPQNLKEIEDNSNYRFIKGDVADPSVVVKVMKGVDVVVNFAAESHVDRSLANPDVFVETNIKGTINLLSAALENKVQRFHHVSTDEVFGALPLDTEKKFNEQTKYDPRSPYSASKAASDHFVNAFYHSFGLPVTITNCSNNYGPYQHPEKMIPRFITNLIDNQKVPVYGDGLYVRDWLFVEDHCCAIETVLRYGKIGETYCVGGLKKDVSNLELTKMLLKIMNKDESFIEYVADRPGHDRKYAVDWSKIAKLGWQPKCKSLKEGLRKTVAWYLANESWWRPLKKESELFYRQIKTKK